MAVPSHVVKADDPVFLLTHSILGTGSLGLELWRPQLSEMKRDNLLRFRSYVTSTNDQSRSSQLGTGSLCTFFLRYTQDNLLQVTDLHVVFPAVSGQNVVGIFTTLRPVSTLPHQLFGHRLQFGMGESLTCRKRVTLNPNYAFGSYLPKAPWSAPFALLPIKSDLLCKSTLIRMS